MLSYIIAITGIGGLIAAVYAGMKAWGVFELVRRSGEWKTRAETAEHELKLYRDMSKIISEARNAQDTQDRLDRGTF